MTTAITRQNIRRELYNQVPGLGFSGIADSLTSTTLVDAYAFGDTTVGPNHYRGFYLYRPTLIGNDTVKKINTLNTATYTVTHSGSAYGDTTATDYEVVGLMHPDELNACIKRALRYIFFDITVPYTPLVTDGDMESSSASSWTSSNLSIKTKVTTAARIMGQGTYALQTTASATDGYAASAAIPVFPQETFYASCGVITTVGTSKLVIYDETNGATIGTAVTSGEAGPAQLWCVGTVPDGCESVTVRLQHTAQNDNAYWSYAIFYRREQLSGNAPTWLDEQYKFLKLREARYNRSLSSQTKGGYNDFSSRVWNDWHQPLHFELEPMHTAANPYQIVLNRMTPENELWIQGKRQWSDYDTLDDDTDTTLAPAHLLYAYAKQEIAKILRMRYPANKAWEILAATAQMDVDAETRSRPETPLQLIKSEHWGRI